VTTDADGAASALVVLDASAVVAMVASGGEFGDSRSWPRTRLSLQVSEFVIPETPRD